MRIEDVSRTPKNIKNIYRTPENIKSIYDMEHLKTSEIILRTTENPS